MPGIMGRHLIDGGRTSYSTPQEQNDKLMALLLGGVDVFGLPSAAAGKVIGPEAEAAMRDPQERNPGMSLMGSVLTGGPVMNGVMKGGAAAYNAARNSPSMAAALLSGGAVGGSIAAGEAEAAQKLNRAQRQQMEMEAQKAKIEAEKEAKRLEAETKAAIARGEGEAAIKARQEQEQAARVAYDGQVKMAEAARDKELSRVRRFSDTSVGQAFESLGGLAPVLAGMAGGTISKAATGPGKTLLSKALKDYVAPAVSGTALGFTAANAPLAYDAFYTDPDNPEKAAYSAYSRELPPGHPRKQEFSDYAEKLPDKNPVREQASKEFYDDLLPRLGMSAIEGGGGGAFGGDAVRAASKAAGAVPGLMAKLLTRGSSAAPEAAKAAAQAAKEPIRHWQIQKKNGVGGRFGPMVKTRAKKSTE